jgi:L-Ala-D/L-Glu epimerase
MHVEFSRVDWPYASVFRIAYRTRTHSETVVVELKDGQLTGRGEALGVGYHGESADSILAQLESVKNDLRNGMSRADLQARLPPGGARNAIDCALWDLEAKRTGRRAWEIAGISTVRPLITAYTLSLDTPEAMGRAAAAVRRYSLLKLKLAGTEDLERVAAVRTARPDAGIIVDANQAWSAQQLEEFVTALVRFDVELIEQPLPVGQDDALIGFKSPIPLCADESCQTVDSLPALIGKYEYINIKLDKTGGLTEALQLARRAQAENFELMVGCMGGTSISMAPGFIVGQLCSVIDLDAPLLLKSDVPGAIHYDGNRMSAPEAALWG